MNAQKSMYFTQVHTFVSNWKCITSVGYVAWFPALPPTNNVENAKISEFQRHSQHYLVIGALVSGSFHTHA